MKYLTNYIKRNLDHHETNKLIAEAKNIKFLQSLIPIKDQKLYTQNKFLSSLKNNINEDLNNNQKQIKFHKTKILIKKKVSIKKEIITESTTSPLALNDKCENNMKIYYKYFSNDLNEENENNEILIFNKLIDKQIDESFLSKINGQRNNYLSKYISLNYNLTNIFITNEAVKLKNLKEENLHKLISNKKKKDHFFDVKLKKIIEFQGYFEWTAARYFQRHKFISQDIFFQNNDEQKGDKNFFLNSFIKYKNEENEKESNKQNQNRLSWKESKKKIKNKNKIDETEELEESDTDFKPLKPRRLKTNKETKLSILQFNNFYGNANVLQSNSPEDNCQGKITSLLGSKVSEKKEIAQIYQKLKSIKRRSIYKSNNITNNMLEGVGIPNFDDFFNYLRMSILQGDVLFFGEYLESMSKYVNINRRDQDGNTLLILATKHGFVNVVNMLLDKKADIDIQNNQGNTALHYAFSQKYFKLADILTKFGAREDLRNIFGLTPWECIGEGVEEKCY